MLQVFVIVACIIAHLLFSLSSAVDCSTLLCAALWCRSRSVFPVISTIKCITQLGAILYCNNFWTTKNVPVYVLHFTPAIVLFERFWWWEKQCIRVALCCWKKLFNFDSVMMGTLIAEIRFFCLCDGMDFCDEFCYEQQ